MDFKKMLKDKLDAQAAIVNAVVLAGRAMSEDEQNKFNDLEVEIKNLEKTIEAQAAIEARQAIDNTVVNPPVRSDIQVTEKKWDTFGNQLQAIRNAATPGGVIDSRLLDGLKVKNASATGLNETINSDGGFMVDEQFVSEMLTRTYETSILANMAKKIPIGPSANGISINGVDETSRANGSRWGGVQAYWTSEAATVTASKPKFKKLEMKLDKLMALCYATDELLTDATALDAVIRQAFTEEMAFKLDDALISGSGAGIPLGLLNSAALVTVNKDASQTNGTITHTNILNMWGRLWARSRGNSVWLINQDCEAQLNNMSVTIGTGGELSIFSKEYMEKGTIKNRPVITLEQCSSLGTVGDIVLADMGQYMLIDKGGITPATSVHVRFLYDEQVFRFTYRVNGMPIWSAPLTPFKGSNTLSPYVTLQAR